MTKVIIFDAGHRKGTPGKRTPDDEREWVFNDKMLRAAVAHLNARYKGFKIVRTDDPNGEKEVTLEQRVKRANDADGDVFVSFHNNANTGKWGSHGGTETFVPSPASKNPKSLALAKEVHPRMQRAFGLRDRGIKEGNLYVIMNTKMPSILLEGAFMDSTTDIGALRDDNKLREVGESIAEGVAAYLRLEKKNQPSAPQVVKPTVEPPEPVVENKPKAGDIKGFNVLYVQEDGKLRYDKQYKSLEDAEKRQRFLLSKYGEAHIKLIRH